MIKGFSEYWQFRAYLQGGLWESLPLTSVYNGEKLEAKRTIVITKQFLV